MYRETSKNQPEFENFKLPFDGKLDKDIRYPTDISILNEAREKTEHIIDELFKPLVGKIKKPRKNIEKEQENNFYHIPGENKKEEEG